MSKYINIKIFDLYKLIVYKFTFIIILIIIYDLSLNNPREEKKVYYNNCFLSPENSNKKIIHIIITRFMIEFYKEDGFVKKIYTKEYIENGIRVMKKYLFPSLEYQRCKDFIWMLNVGDKANITLLKSLLNFKKSFKSIIIYNKEQKNYIKSICKNADVLITTRIDYDDRIYYDAVNDVRKAVNISKPIFLYGYDRGYIYYEELDIYTKFIFKKKLYDGTMSVFESLIIFTKKINDYYTIYSLGDHRFVRKKLLIISIKPLNNLEIYGSYKLKSDSKWFGHNII